jgi:hypothetical protein
VSFVATFTNVTTLINYMYIVLIVNVFGRTNFIAISLYISYSVNYLSRTVATQFTVSLIFGAHPLSVSHNGIDST